MDDCVAIAKRLATLGGSSDPDLSLRGRSDETRLRNRPTSVADTEGLGKNSPTRWNRTSARRDDARRATVIGPPFLIAYNINLNSTDKNHASDSRSRSARRACRSQRNTRRILRQEAPYARARSCGARLLARATSGRSHWHGGHGYDLGELLRANDLDPPNVVGKQVYRPGLFKAARPSLVVKDYDRRSVDQPDGLRDERPARRARGVAEARRRRGLVVTGSEIVASCRGGDDAGGKYYLGKQGAAGAAVGDVLRQRDVAGLNDVAPFDVRTKILGYPWSASALVQRTVLDFTDEVSRDSPAREGLGGGLAGPRAALASMVANLTYGKEGRARDAELARVAEEAQRIKTS